MKTIRSAGVGLLAVTLLGQGGAAFAGTGEDLVKTMEREESTWHKHDVFTTAASAVLPPDKAPVLAWLRGRLDSGKASDSRYALVYSSLLMESPRQEDQDTGMLYAVAGYMALQFESGRCETRNESIQVARQWYGPVTPQIRAFVKLPKERKAEILAAAEPIADRLSTVPVTAEMPGSAWMCYLLPSYARQIGTGPDVEVDRRTQGPVSRMFVRNRAIQPTLAPEEKFQSRRKGVLDDMKSW
ncbi:hypothetical protein [Mitsuaria sp. GD03876]|uniref:hypothetical protein n=1 Tax=Mitsuaria sp. GD03876 TaxID=2975399 RepID=UPI0024480A58|nr:hypothetical protein [Mitsuaria sp. GD03876]MDH0865819.1 hypothetical protein [Mitsuaria sp. GD03876]